MQLNFENQKSYGSQ